MDDNSISLVTALHGLALMGADGIIGAVITGLGLVVVALMGFALWSIALAELR
jgi:hypothetical protein